MTDINIADDNTALLNVCKRVLECPHSRQGHPEGSSRYIVSIDSELMADMRCAVVAAEGKQDE